MRGKWLINGSKEPGMINTTLDNGRNLRQLIGVSLFLAFQAIREILKYFKFRLTPNQDSVLHTRSGITDGDSGIYRIKWRTDARDSANLTMERA